MSAQSETRIIPTYKEIIAHLRTPIYRNGYFLLISSLSTSGIGLIYWILAAHRYSTYILGINSAIIAAMTFLAGIAELNLMSALMRFIPVAGRRTKRFVLLAYLSSLVLSGIISFVFIKNLGFWSPALRFLGDNPMLSLWFILATMSWCIFVLQDSVLTGLRQTSWVPVENTVFSLTKVALMLIFVATIPALGIFASWTFALIVAVFPTNYFIFRKLIPAHENKEEQAQPSIESKQVIRFAATDYLGALFWIMANTLMPVIVTTVSGATANAYFYLAWTIANTLYLIGPAMGSSLVVETAKDQEKLGYYSHRMYKNTMKIVVPVALLITIAAPYILLIFGKGYSQQGAIVLRLLALSAIPNVINSIYVSTARAQRKVGEEVLALGILCSLLLGSSYVFLRLFGITGVGIGWLGSQLLVAIFVYSLKLHRLWKNREQDSEKSVWGGFFAQYKPGIYSITYRMARALNILSAIRHSRESWFMRTKQNRVTSVLPQIIAELDNHADGTNVAGWKLMRVANNQTNTIVAFLMSINDHAPVVVKIPSSTREAESLKKQSENLITLASNEELGAWRKLLPAVVTCGSVQGCDYFIEQTMPGKQMRKLFPRRGVDWGLVSLAAEAINDLHRKTARCVEVDESLIQLWIDDPIQNLINYSSGNSIQYPYQNAIELLHSKLVAAVAHRQVCVSWIHGDYSPANILVDPLTRKITGIVDWDLARPNELPLVDLMHLFISIRMDLNNCEMGRVVSDLLQNQSWNPLELKILQAVGQDLQGNAIDLQALLLLTWLRHINANLMKTDRFDNHKLWADENYTAVLHTLEGIKA